MVLVLAFRCFCREKQRPVRLLKVRSSWCSTLPGICQTACVSKNPSHPRNTRKESPEKGRLSSVCFLVFLSCGSCFSWFILLGFGFLSLFGFSYHPENQGEAYPAWESKKIFNHEILEIHERDPGKEPPPLVHGFGFTFRVVRAFRGENVFCFWFCFWL